MRTIDLTKRRHSLAEILSMARSESLLVHCASGDDFLIEAADDFDREAAALGKNDRFMSFLAARAGETGDIPIGEVHRRRGAGTRRLARKGGQTGGPPAAKR